MTFPNNYNKQSGLTSGQAGKIKHSVFYSCFEIRLKDRQKPMIINHLILIIEYRIRFHRDT